MEVLQHYYTSYQDKETGNVGFQVKAVSPGLSLTQEATIQRLISYRIPPECEMHNLSTHPVALRYLAPRPQEGILVCSQSCGRDVDGRPGNFFAHSLVTDSQHFRAIPPILYWQHPFWRKQDTRPHPQTKTLPVLPGFDLSPSLPLADVWSFLAQGNRRHSLHQLLCAVIHSQQQRIIIADSAQHVALWIAAVSLLLPPDYRPLLSFATYHDDPYQGQFLITGVTQNTSFRSTDYQSYFILDDRSERTCTVQKSPYADMVVALAQADLYETQLRPLFARLASVTPVLDEQLDSIALYAGLPLLPPDTSVQQVQRLWDFIGGVKDDKSQALFSTNLRTIGHLWREERSEEGNKLLLTLWHAIQTQAQVWLQYAKDKRVSVPDTLMQWRKYSDAFVQSLRQPETAQQTVELLDFWFSVSADAFQYPYTLPAFFLTLSQALTDAQQERGFGTIIHNVQPLIVHKSWYPAIQRLFSERKRLFSTLRQGLATSLPKREKHPVKADILQLFAHETAQQQHRQLVTRSPGSDLEQFWENYWEIYNKTFNLLDPPIILAVLSFWFNESFALIHDNSLLPYTFFLNLSRICQESSKKPGFRALAQALDQQARQEKYPWYSLVKPLFSAFE